MQETGGLVVGGTSSSGNNFQKPWKRFKTHRKGTVEPWERLSSVLAATGEWDYASLSFTSSNANIASQISDCSFFKPVTLQTSWTLVQESCNPSAKRPSLVDSLRWGPCHVLWSFLYSCISRKGGRRYPQQFPECCSLFDASLPFSFLLATKFVLQSWQALVTHKSRPLSNHFHSLSMNFLHFSCTVSEMEMNTAFKAKAHHLFM